MNKKINFAKRTVCGVLSVFAVLSGAYAGEYGVSYTKDGIRISGTTDKGVEKIYISVYPKNCESFAAVDLLGLTIANADTETSKANVELGIRQDGDFADRIDGIDIYIREDAKDEVFKISDDFSPKRVYELLNAVKSDSSPNSLKNILADEYYLNAKKLIGIDEYDSIDNEKLKENMVSVLSKSVEVNGLTKESFEKSFVHSLGVAEINTGVDAEGGIKRADPSFEGKKYNDSSDEKFKKWIVEMSKTRTYESTERYYDSYALFSMLYGINGARSGEMFNTIAKYADKIGISDDEYYKKYSAANSERRDRISEKIANILFSENAKSGSDVADAIKKAYNAVIKENTEKDNSGGSSGGGSGGSSRIFNSANTKDSFSVNGKTEGKEPDGSGFGDLGDAEWARDAIEFLLKAGIVNGTGENKFEPNEKVTREQLAKMLVMAAGVSVGEDFEAGFSDVPKASWFFKYVGAAYKSGIVYGKDTQTFGAGELVTRQDTAVMAYRAAKARGIAVSGTAPTQFGDAAEIADYAKEAVEALSSAGIVSGNENRDFAPLAECTRAEAAKMIYLLFYNRH